MQLRFRPPLSYPFHTSDSPLFALPPLRDVTSASHIVHRGNTYSFVPPRSRLPEQGWIAYAPLTHQIQISREPIVLNTPVSVVIENG